MRKQIPSDEPEASVRGNAFLWVQISKTWLKNLCDNPKKRAPTAKAAFILGRLRRD